MNYHHEIADGWDIGGVPNGGYVMSFAVSSMLIASERPDPVSVTAHFLRPAAPGHLTVTTEVVKTGRSFTTISASAIQDDLEILRLLGVFGDLDSMGGLESVTATAPDVEVASRCVLIKERQGHPFAFAQKVRQLIDPSTAGYLLGDATGKAELTGWMGFVDGRIPQTTDLATLADGFPPPIFNLGIAPGWVPTVELTLHVRSRPTSPLLIGRFAADFVNAGLLTEDGQLFDANGKLVALSRQLALVPRADHTWGSGG